jgi:glycosyltransferase involved in cell wall biosynthesis
MMSSRNPLFSVITVVRNDVDNIENTLLSVIGQTLRSIEYIVVDGRSTDGTLDVLNKHKAGINILISEKDHGIYDAMNKGLSISRGEWVIFINSGDRLYSSSTLEQLAGDIRPGRDIIYGHCEVRYGTFSRIKKAKGIEKLWQGMPFCHQSLLVRNELLKDRKFDTNYSLAADYNLVGELYSRQCKYFGSDIVISSISAAGRSDNDRIEVLRQYRAISSQYFKRDVTALYFTVQIGYAMLLAFIKKHLPVQMWDRLVKNKYKLLNRSAS